MKLDVVRADPAGNITLFVLNPVKKEERAQIAEKLLSMTEFQAEQVGYRVEPEKGYDGHLEMAGGEFCGNAARAFGMMIAREKGLSGAVHLVIKVSGCPEPVYVDADMEAGTSRASMPLPRYVSSEEIGEVRGVLVHLGGIAHLVVEHVEPTVSFFEEAERALFARMENLDAYGVMFYDSETRKLVPLVKVPAANSLYWEGSCGSGSLAAAIAQTAGVSDGIFFMDLFQPAGCVRAEVYKRQGEITEAYIGGSVSLEPQIVTSVI